VLVPAFVVAALVAPASARAGNGDLPRTPMQHQGEQCLTVVDRSVDPVVHLAYTIPFTDTCLTEDELPGSRTHQLIAFCHGDIAARTLPHWHTRAEADLAAAAKLATPIPVPASDILDENPDYTGCWHPILRADQRRAITCAAARPGVDWDTTDLPVGTYVVRGYTFEPPLNTWSPRRGLFKVVDDASDPAASPPSVAIANVDTFLWKSQPMRVRLCVDAMDGSTVTLAHSPNTADPTWTPFLVDEPVSSGTVELEFPPPAALAGEFITLRAEIVDPMDRRFVAFMQGEVNIQVSEDPEGKNEPVGVDDDLPPPYDFCAENPDADDTPDCPVLTTGDTTDASSSASSDACSDDTSDETGETGGCACRSAPTRPAPWLLLALLPGLLPRRRTRLA
jgi:hypothetical protein